MGWWQKFQHKPPFVKPQSVYALEGTRRGHVVFVVAPGPSLDEFPKEELSQFTTIAVNAAAEIISPTYFLFQEGFLAKRYYPIYKTDWIKRIVTTRARDFIARLLPVGHEFYTYTFLDRPVLSRSKRRGFLDWRDPDSSFLPGRMSISSNAISLGCLMGAELIICVGVDFHMGNEPDKYYANGVKINRGPRLRAKALSAGGTWATLAARKGIWKGPRILTTSPWLSLRGFTKVSPAEALAEAKAQEERSVRFAKEHAEAVAEAKLTIANGTTLRGQEGV